MRKIYIILSLALFLFGAGQADMADSTRIVRVVETPIQDTKVGEAKMKAAHAENMEALLYQKIDSARISQRP